MEHHENDVFGGLGVEILLKEPDDFLKVKETLTRIGMSSEHSKTLYQSCHILHKRGRYAIVHFKELFVLDGKESTLTEEDIARRNTIADLLQQWNLAKVVKPEQIQQPRASMGQIKVVPHKEKHDWHLVSKYQFGKKDKS
jgi:hypothetical protein